MEVNITDFIVYLQPMRFSYGKAEVGKNFIGVNNKKERERHIRINTIRFCCLVSLTRSLVHSLDSVMELNNKVQAQ